MAPVVTSAPQVRTKTPPRILVVDDEPTLIELVGDVVGRQIPCRLVAANSIAEGSVLVKLDGSLASCS